MANHFTQGLILSLAFILVGCSKQNALPVQTQPTLEPAQAVLYLESLRETTDSQHQTTLAKTRALESLIMAFLAEPGPDSLQLAQTAWHEAHIAWAANQFGFFAITGELPSTVYQIDAWPILPGFLDALDQYPDSGIISDLALPITQNNLIQQHGITDPSEVSLGFHALEYFLFARPIEDFQPSPTRKNLQDTHQSNKVEERVQDTHQSMPNQKPGDEITKVEDIHKLDQDNMAVLNSLASKTDQKNMDVPNLSSDVGNMDVPDLSPDLSGDEFGVGEMDAEVVAERIVRRRRLVELVARQLSQDMSTLTGLLAEQYQMSDPAADAPRLVYRFTEGTLDKLQSAFRESHLLVDREHGHATFGGASLATLATELLALEQVTKGSQEWRALVSMNNDDLMHNYSTTLEQAINIASNPDSEEINLAKLPLMLSAILHQMESFELLISRRADGSQFQ